jgi:hypothetical protein
MRSTVLLSHVPPVSLQDVGDTLLMEGNFWKVKNISLLYTVLKKVGLHVTR